MSKAGSHTLVFSFIALFALIGLLSAFSGSAGVWLLPCLILGFLAIWATMNIFSPKE
jgi:hypothetical protein